jgi:hypothetical protein
MKSLWATPIFHLFESLTLDKGASTFVRLFRSRHVADLQLIFWSSCLLMLAGSVFVSVWHTWVDSTGVVGSATLISAIVGVGCGVLAWTYQTGSVRLGVVDLFSCEITTICRVLAVVNMAPHLVQMYRTPPPVLIKFNSQEQYSPVFDNNSKDLEVLEARVVERVTEFYTYLKAMRDYFRILDAIEQPRDNIDRWHLGVRNVIYMLFLMLESARATVDRLIEYEPERAENTIMILLSELVAFGLLLEDFEARGKENKDHDARLERLRLRKGDYPPIVSSIYTRTLASGESEGPERERWQRAVALIGELNQRYHEVFGEWIDPVAASAASRAMAQSNEA